MWVNACRARLTSTKRNTKCLLISVSESPSVMSDSLWPHGLYSLWNSPDQNSGVGSLSFLHGIFPTQGLIPGLLHYRQILYQLSHNRSSKVVFMWISGSVEIIKCIDVVRCLWNAYVGFLGLPDLPLWHHLKQKELKGLSWWSGG